MRIYPKYYLIFMLILITASCNKDLDIDLPEPDDKIVVDGWIEQGQHD